MIFNFFIFLGLILIVVAYIYHNKKDFMDFFHKCAKYIADNQLPIPKKLKKKTLRIGKLKKVKFPAIRSDAIMHIATGIIGVAVVLMVGYMVLTQVQSAIKDNPQINASVGPNINDTIFAGFGLVAVGIIVLAAFGIIQIFR